MLAFNFNVSSPGMVFLLSNFLLLFTRFFYHVHDNYIPTILLNH